MSRPKNKIITVIKVRGILRHNNDVLLCFNKSQSFYFLPGGTLEENSLETLESALIREFIEETGIKIKIEKFIGCLECHWSDRRATYREINLIFTVKPLEKICANNVYSQEEHISFELFSQDKIKETKIYPLKIKDYIINNESESGIFKIENQV